MIRTWLGWGIIVGALMGCGLHELEAAPRRLTRPVSNPPVVATHPSRMMPHVLVSGNRQVASQTIQQESGLMGVTEYDPFLMVRATRSLQSMGLFQSVQVTVNAVKNAHQWVVMVQENPVIGSIQLVGVSVIPSADIMAVLQSKVGSLVHYTDLRADARAIEALYHQQGYVLAKVKQFIWPSSNGGALGFEVDEGVIERVEVTGNLQTKAYVITRELLSQPGMIVNIKRVGEDMRRVYNLGYFTGIQPDMIDPITWQLYTGESIQGHVLRFKVDEKPSNTTLTAGASYSAVIGLTGTLSAHLDNLFGTGQLVDTQLQVGRATTIQFKYFNPWMWDGRRSFMARVWNRTGSVDQFMLNSSTVTFRDEQAFGFDVMFGIPMSYELNLTHTVKVENVYLPGYDLRYSLQTYRFGMSYDTRDVRFNPLNGQYAFGSFEFALPLADTSLDFLRLDMEWRSFFQTFDKQTIAFRTSMGALFGSRIGDSRLFAREYYRVGGTYTVRGWNDFSPFAIGAKQWLASLEYRWQLHDMLQVVAFIDTGYATNDNPFNWSAFRIGKGVGIRLNVPALGPLRLDWAMGDGGDSVVHFSMGHAF